MKQKPSLSTTNLLQQTPNPIAFLDTDFKFVRVSKPWLAKFKVTENETIGRPIFEVFPLFSGDWSTKLRYALDGLKDIQIIDPSTYGNQNDNSFIWNLNPWQDDKGNNLGVVLSVKDFTEINSLKLELQKTKNQLKEKANIAKIGSWEYAVASNLVYLSPLVREIFKLKDNDFLKLNDAVDLYKKGISRKKIRKAIFDAIENGTPWNQNLQLTSSDDSPVWVNIIGRPKFSNGRCTRIIGTIQDISEKVKLEQKTFVDKLPFENQTFFDLAPVGMALVDFKTGKLLTINKALKGLTGYSSQEIVGQSYEDFNIFKTVTQKNTAIGQLKKTQAFKSLTVELQNKNSLITPYLLTGSLITNVNNQRAVLISFEKKLQTTRINTELKQQLKKAEENTEKLVNFTHMVSHNLKANSVNFSLLLDFLENEEDDKKRKKMISVLKDGNKSLSETIKGLRELVAIRENTNIKKKALVLNAYIYKAEQNLSGVIRQHEAKIINEVPENTKVIALAPYLENILSNIISNAIKFRNPQKQPVIILNAEVQKEVTIISIEDNGMGMDLSKHPEKLFELYTTVGNALDSRGMGLYLTHYQVELMKGTITVESQLGEGSIFKISLPN